MTEKVLTISCTGETRHACAVAPAGFVREYVRSQTILHHRRFPECSGKLEYQIKPRVAE